MPNSTPSPGRRTDLYRFYDRTNRLLYIGISLSAAQRASQHRADKQWWDDVARMEVQHLGEVTRPAAEQIERDAILAERPVHNVVHNRPNAPLRSGLRWTCGVCLEHVEVGDGMVYLPHREMARHAAERLAYEANHPSAPADASPLEQLRATVLTADALDDLPGDAHWLVAHYTCAGDDSAAYLIEVERIPNAEAALWWTAHLLGKSWFADTNWDRLLHRVLNQRWDL